MTVYNITEFIKTHDEHNTLETVKKHYELTKIQIMFSDWFIDYGIKTVPKNVLTEEQKKAIIKLLDKRTGMDSETPMYVLQAYPKVNKMR